MEVEDVCRRLEAYRWKREGEYCPMIDAASFGFISWRKGQHNIILTANRAFADRHRAATHVCKRLNLLDKQDRIAVFQAVLYGNKWEGGDGGH